MGEANRRAMFASLAGAAAVPPRESGGVVSVPQKVVAQVPGFTTLVLEDGTVLVGQITTTDVKKRMGVKDQHGNDMYDINWDVQTATVKRTG